MLNSLWKPGKNFRFSPQLVTSIRYIRHTSYLGNVSSGKHFHPRHEYELIYVDYGILNLEYSDRKFQLRQGECILLKGCVFHRLFNLEKIPMNYLNVMFSGKLPGSITEKVLPLDRHEHRAMNRLREESIMQMEYCPSMSACELTIFLISLIRRQKGVAPSMSPPANLGNAQSSLAQKALDIISRNYKSLKSHELARSLGVSDSSLYLIFKNEIGRSFSQTIQIYRVEAAKIFLQKGDLSLNEIAFAIGCEARSFFRLFKRVAGMTPLEYARSLGIPNNLQKKSMPTKFRIIK